MTRTPNARVLWHGRMFVAVGFAGPMIALFSQLSPFIGHAGGPMPRSAHKAVHAEHMRAGATLAVRSRAADPGGHPGRRIPGPSAASAPPSGPAGGRALPATPAGGQPSGFPELSIGVDDGRQTAKAGDLLNYTVKIHNIGETNARGLEIVQTLPTGLKLISANRSGVAHAGQVKWKVNLPAGRADTFGVVGRVGQTPGRLLRLATIACATAGGGVRPIVCAAHSDELPAGAVAAAAQRRHAAAAAGGHTFFWYLLLVGVALVLGAAAVLAGRRLLRRRPSGAS